MPESLTRLFNELKLSDNVVTGSEPVNTDISQGKVFGLGIDYVPHFTCVISASMDTLSSIAPAPLRTSCAPNRRAISSIPNSQNSYCCDAETVHVMFTPAVHVIGFPFESVNITVGE